MYLVIPQLRMLAAVTLKKMCRCLVNNLCLTIDLWMESHNPLQLGVNHSPQTCPKLSKESSISIRDDGHGKPKVDTNILKEEISSFLSNDILFTWHQYTHLVKPIHYYIQVVMTPFRHW